MTTKRRTNIVSRRSKFSNHLLTMTADQITFFYWGLFIEMTCTSYSKRIDYQIKPVFVNPQHEF